MMMKFFHCYHLVTLSPWPLLVSMSVMYLMLGVIFYFYKVSGGLLGLGVIIFILVLIQWWRDVIRESMYQGVHLIKVIKGLRMSMLLFILSEVMFFISFFWVYFHMFLSPSVDIGNCWPPMSIEMFNPYSLPFLNTLLLLTSGVFITWGHYELLLGEYSGGSYALKITLSLGAGFLFCQKMEYMGAYFTMSDSIYGAIFYLVTGFHGMHVIIGGLFLYVVSIRLNSMHLSKIHHFGFEAAAWYWHFVDIVWLFLYMFIYWLSY
uniref:Cytochrome c oxidase subunit 3 n=1 Tax=Afrocampsis griseosetosus TaxID=1491719 RepID=A0A0U1WH36_9HYME|nr:cytochrome c oxidase subunit III [Afrocampsis griseosetosus]